MSKIKIVYNHPNPNVMAQTPRVLEYVPKGKDKEPVFYEPAEEDLLVEGRKIKAVTYELDEAYGRILLSTQPERFFLLEPASLIVKEYAKDNLSYKNIKIHSIISDKHVIKPKADVAPAPNKNGGKAPQTAKAAVAARDLEKQANAKKQADENSGASNENSDAGDEAPLNPLDRPSID